jgi:hypothetical protein
MRQPPWTIQTYQHVLPGMQEAAAEITERLAVPRARQAPWNTAGTPGGRRREAVEHPGQQRSPRSLTWGFINQLVAGAGFELATFGL